MPEPVAQGAQADAVINRAHFVIAIEVGNVGHFELQAPFFGLGHFAARGNLQLAKVPAERQLGVVVEMLLVEHQHGEPVHAGLDRGNLRRGQGPGQVNA